MRYYIVDAFAEHIFAGNPAAVCVLDAWPADELMQNIARENNLSETAFAVREGEFYHLRWFTPAAEIDLCGHATLAAGYTIMRFVEPQKTEILFHTQSGQLCVRKCGDLYEMDFPSYDLQPVAVSTQIEQAIGVRPLEAWLGRDFVCVLENEAQIYNAGIDLQQTQQLPGALLHITARGQDYDCVSRSFAPKLGVEEDPVCGSGHCHIAPLWAEKLHKQTLVARQASARGDTLYCTVDGDRTKLSGHAALYASGEIHL